MKLLGLAWLLACLVVPFGAYVRLSQSGLGCPDWPGCFGRFSPRYAATAITQAQRRAPDGPVSVDKAWREMTHRYLAASLGALLLLYALQSLYRRRQRLSAILLLVAVLLQGALGMLTVTWLLQPLIVCAHLLLGMTLAAGLAAGLWSQAGADTEAVRAVRRLSRALLALLLLQVFLGGWVSSHHAALACAGFPRCNGAWLPPEPLEQGLGLRPVYDGAALMDMQWLHRLGALLVSLLLACLLVLGLLWAAQVSLGVANVLLARPVALAVAHNLGALALLSATMVLALRRQEHPS
jgi:cytochrome c oxidase assembly protein subunit 15